MAEEFNLSAATCALNGGEDYELLFTIAQNHYDAIKNDPDFTVVGHITHASQGAMLLAISNHQTLTAQGWNALS